MWWIITSGILFIIVYLLFAPFFLEIDSTTGLFRARFHMLASGGLLFHSDSIFLELKIGWWKKEYDLLQQTKKKHHHDELFLDSLLFKEKPPVSVRKTVKKIKAIVQSFRVKKCYIMMDTGSMQWNGILYPWFYLLSLRTKKTLMINFRDENTIVLQLENSLARMLWAYVKS